MKPSIKVVATRDTKFVAAFESKNQPFYGVHFHAEKNLFERGSKYDNLCREHHTIETSRGLLASLTSKIRQKGRPILVKNINSQLRQYFASFRPAEMPMIDDYERIFTFQRFNL